MQGGGNDLTLNFTAETTIDGAQAFANVGSFTSLGDVRLNGTIQTIAAQNYAANVTLFGATTLDGTVGTLANGVVGGGNDLTLNFTGGTTKLDGSFVGLANLTSLGDVSLNSDMTTSGSQNYAANVSLAGDTNLTGTSGTFAQGITGNNNSLLFNFSQPTAIGGLFNNLANFTSLGDVTVNGTISTNVDQTYAANVTLTGDGKFNGNAASFSGAVIGGNHDLTINFIGGSTALGGLFTNVATLNALSAVDIGANIQTNVDQVYGSNVTLTGDAVLTGNAAAFASGLNGAAHDLGLNFTGLTTIDGATTFTNIGNLTSTGPTALNGTVQTIGSQTYSGNVSLIGATTLEGTTSAFSGSVQGGNNDLTLNFSAETTIDGSQTFGNVANLTSLGDVRLNGTIQTNAAQNYAANTILFGATTAEAGTDVSFGGLVNGGSALTINSTGTTTFSGAVGSTVALSSLTTNAGGTTLLGGDVTTTGNQSFGDQVNMTGSVTLVSGAGTIDASSGINGTGQTLTVGDANQTGDVTLGGNIALGSLQTGNGSFDVAIESNNAVITGDGLFVNNGSVTLNSTGLIIAFDSGLNTTAVSQTILSGYIETSNRRIELNNVTLTGSTTLHSSQGVASFGNEMMSLSTDWK